MTRVIFWKEFREQRFIALALALFGLLAMVAGGEVAAGRGGWFFDGTREVGFLSALLLAITCGVVTGAMLLAGESEGRTLALLDTLPTYRGRLWWGKFAFGALLTLVQVGLLISVGTRLGAFDDSGLAPPLLVVILAGFALYAYGWGLVGSSLVETVLAAIGVALACMVAFGLVHLLATVILNTVILGMSRSRGPEWGVGLAAVILTPVPLLLSYRVFTRLDRQRFDDELPVGWIPSGPFGARLEEAPVRPAPRPAPLARSAISWDDLPVALPVPEEALTASPRPAPVAPRERPRSIPAPVRSLPEAARKRRHLEEGVVASRLVVPWLVWRQGRGLAGILFLIALVFGPALHLNGLVLWPIGTLLIGMVCGLAAFLPDRAGGYERFLGDQRFSAGRVWAWKAGIWFLVAGLLWGTVLLGGTLYALRQDGSPLPTPHTARQAFAARFLGFQAEQLRYVEPGPYALLWGMQGFAIGLLYGMVCRKTVVAGFMGFMSCVGSSVFWVPTLVSGGLPTWEVLGAPVILLLAGRLLMWSWMGNRLNAPRPVGGLVAAALLAVLWTAGVMGLRVAETPDVGQPFDVAAYKAALPSIEKNRSGRLIKDVAQAMSTANPMPISPSRPELEAMLDAGVLQPGTPEWLSLTFAGGKARWLAEMRDTLALDRVEPGVINLPTDLRDVNVADQTSSSRSFTVPTGRTGLLMLARAIQLWNRGDEREAVTLLVETLSLSRLMRRQATVSTYRVGLDLEKRAAACLGQWAWHRGRVGPSKEERLALFREALQELATNEAEAPPVASALQAEYVAANNALSLLDTSNLTNLADVRNRFSLLRQAPWEKARAQRLVDAVFAGWLRAFARGYPEAPKPSADILSAGIAADAFPLGAWEAEDGTGPDGPAGQKLSRLVAGSWVVEKLCRETAALQRAEFDARCRRGGTRLILALALYESEHGKSAQRLADLPGDYFPAGLPLDPYSGESFRYRVTTGAETLIGEPRGPGSPERRLSAGQGVVYSVGPDGVDDGGKQHGGELKPGQAVDSSDGLDLLFLVPRSAAGRGPRL